MATIETREPTAAAVRKQATRKVRVVIRRVSPWSVLKFSLLFYFCVMLVVLVGLMILFTILSAMGVIANLESLIGQLWPADTGTFRIDGGYIFRMLFLIGVVSTVLWSAVTVFVAFLYNLIADLVGGIEVTLTERR